MKRLLCLIIILCSFQKHSFSQDQHFVDSLEAELKNYNAHKLELKIKDPSIQDSIASNILNNLSWAFWGSDPVKAMDYAKQGLALSEQIGYKKGIADAYNNMGMINFNKGDYLPALAFQKKALKIREEIGNTKGIAGSYNNIGMIYGAQGNYTEALTNYFAALKMNEQSGNKSWQAMNLTNIGGIYANQNNFSEAHKQYSAALKINEEIGDKLGMADSYSQIAYLNYPQGRYPEALKNILAALKIQEDIMHKGGIAASHTLLGVIKMKQGNYSEALEHEFAALKMQEELEDKSGMVNSIGCIGEIYFSQKNYEKCAEYFNKAFEMSKSLGGPGYMSYAYESLARLDSATGNYKQAMEHYKLYIAARDSLVNNENTKKMTQQQLQFEFDKKESLTKAENEKELQKQKLVRNGFVGGFAVVLLFAGVFFRQRNKISKEKKISEAEKERSEELLLNILPAEVAEEIKTTGTAKTKSYTMVTVMFADFKDFTSVSEKISGELLVGEIHTCFSAFDIILQKHRIEKIKTIGDAYLCASGLPVSNYTHAVDMLNASLEIRNYMLQRKKEKEALGEIPFEIRIGIHTGPVVAGIVGIKKYAYDIWGDTVNLAARMEQNSEAGKINISESTYGLVKDLFTFTYRGKIQAKNKGDIDMYFAETIS